jgi:hypothetical protein
VGLKRAISSPRQTRCNALRVGHVLETSLQAATNSSPHRALMAAAGGGAQRASSGPMTIQAITGINAQQVINPDPNAAHNQTFER